MDMEIVGIGVVDRRPVGTIVVFDSAGLEACVCFGGCAMPDIAGKLVGPGHPEIIGRDFVTSCGA